MGSVKNLNIIEKPDAENFGFGVFEFTDDYSVFDYGKMPDIIEGKGESLCRMAVENFKGVQKLGVKTHLRNFMSPNKMEVNLVRVLRPGKDLINTETTNYLVPLEIIFRNSLPPGSSIFKALERGELTPKDLGLNHMPVPGEKLENPIIDMTTKLEVTDRRVSLEEAKSMSGLTENDMQKIKEIALKVNQYITKKASSIGLEHADGKIEVAIGPDRNLLVVDVFGTLDENRFLFGGFHVSKQVLRDYYKKTPWYAELEKAKSALPKSQWPKPNNLPIQLVTAVSNMYKSVCQKWTGHVICDASLEDSIEIINEFVY